MQRTSLAGAAAAALALAAAAPAGHALPADGLEPAAPGATVHVTDFVYTPSAVKVRRGQEVEWSFDQGTHTATDTTGMDLYSSNVRSSGTFSFTFVAAGRYGFRCLIHAFMTGTVSVPLAASPRSGPPDGRFAVV
jgi:plastocyanin